MEPLNARSLEILRHIVEAYVETGEPIGSLTVAHRLDMSLSSATIRNIMARLEEMGLLYSPHTSAGRLPTEAGLRFFVQGFLETRELSLEEKRKIEGQCSTQGLDINSLLNQASTILSGLSSCAGIVIAPKDEAILKHIEFIPLDPGKALVIMVSKEGTVENRIIEIPVGIPPSSLIEAGNYLNAHLAGKTLEEAKNRITHELSSHRAHLDEVAEHIVKAGLGVWSGSTKDPSLIIQGQSNLLKKVEHMEDLNAIKSIFSLLDRKEVLINLLDGVMKGDGIQIFIGAENEWFQHVGCSLVLSPYENSSGKIVGAIGIIGPTRINYGHIIPVVDYTAKIVSRLIK
jgi:heat-inducible transcriptional repressor